MNMREMEVTPDMATKWLEGNTHNRGVRDTVVERYARDMKAGRWMLTHEAIAFDHDGTLIDGQHRLWAVVTSKSATRFMVARDADLLTQAVIDGSLPRTMVDVMKLAYDRHDVNAIDISVAKALAAGRTKGPLTRQEIVAAFDQHQEAIRFAVQSFPRKVRGVTIAPVFTVIARAWYTADRARLAEFAEVMSSGKLHTAADDAALLLRNWLLEKAPTKGGSSRDAVVYGKTERALASFLIGESIAILYAASSELFPLPIEEAKSKRPAARSTRELQRRVAKSRQRRHEASV